MNVISVCYLFSVLEKIFIMFEQNKAPIKILLKGTFKP